MSALGVLVPLAIHNAIGACAKAAIKSLEATSSLQKTKIPPFLFSPNVRLRRNAVNGAHITKYMYAVTRSPSTTQSACFAAGEETY